MLSSAVCLITLRSVVPWSSRFKDRETGGMRRGLIWTKYRTIQEVASDLLKSLELNTWCPSDSGCSTSAWGCDKIHKQIIYKFILWLEGDRTSDLHDKQGLWLFKRTCTWKMHSFRSPHKLKCTGWRSFQIRFQTKLHCIFCQLFDVASVLSQVNLREVR